MCQIKKYTVYYDIILFTNKKYYLKQLIKHNKQKLIDFQEAKNLFQEWE